MESFSKVINGMLAISIVPFIMLNVLGSIVSTIWLLFLGEWRLVVMGVIFILISSFVISILLLPTMGFMYLILKSLEKNRRVLVAIVGWLNLTYTHVIGLVWTIGIFILMFNIAGDGNVFPYLLFGYGLATGPYAYMASKEDREATGSHMTVWLLQFAYALLFLFYYVSSTLIALPIILIVTLLVEIWLLKIGMIYHKLDTQHAQ
ncbi:MAG TPA: hypothetical protein VHE10_02455 [Candidatus Paceibacterota bacterium]|nr:hypothetical protein [Candidatus Paceibacterota bacterium]